MILLTSRLGDWLVSSIHVMDADGVYNVELYTINTDGIGRETADEESGLRPTTRLVALKGRRRYALPQARLRSVEECD
jgi:hypothetical protein